MAPSYTIDPDAEVVNCRNCGAEVDPFVALYNIARNGQRLKDRERALAEDIREAETKRTQMTVFKELERWYRGKKKMVPHCPVCHAPFAFEEITGWVSIGRACAERGYAPEFTKWFKLPEFAAMGHPPAKKEDT